MKNRHHPGTATGRRLAVLLSTVAALLLALAGQAFAVTTQVSTGLTNVLGILQIAGTDGKRHVWISDHLNGVCRMDPVGATAQLALNQASCVLFVGGAIKAGQLSYDPVNKKIYAPDLSSKSQGVLRLGYDPALDAGRGGITLLDRTALVSNCGLAGSLPWGSALGPDGDLYVSFKKSASITRIHNPALAGSVSANCATDVQSIGNAADGKSAFQVTFVGHDLWEVDNVGMGAIVDAVAAARPAGTRIVDGGVVRTFPTATPARNAVSVFVGAMPGNISVTSDSARKLLYVGTASSVFRVNLATGTAPAVLATGFTFVTGLYVDPTVAPSSLYVADDTSRGVIPGNGRLFKVVV